MKQKEETTASVAQADRSAMFILFLIVVILALAGMSLLGGLVLIAVLKEYNYERF